MSPAASQCAKKAKVERVISVAGLSAFGITSAPALASIPKPRREMSPKVTKTNMATQRKALRALRKDFQKRKADLRTIAKNRKTAMTRIRADIKNLEEEIKTANEELSVEFDSGSSCFSSSDSESSSSSSKAPVKEAVPSSKGKPQAAQGAVPSPKGTLQEEGKRKRRRRLPFLVPGAPAPDHQGWPTRVSSKTTRGTARLANSCDVVSVAQQRHTVLRTCRVHGRHSPKGANSAARA